VWTSTGRFRLWFEDVGDRVERLRCFAVELADLEMAE
jgi:hypothetical protein